MAILKPIFMTGFETNSSDVFESTTGTVTIQTATVNKGTYAACHESASTAVFDLDDDVKEIFLSINVDPDSVHTGGGAGRYFDIIAVLSDDKEIKLRLDSGGEWDAYVDGVEVASGVQTAPNEFHNVQLRIKISNTNGTIQSYVDNELDIIYVGDTKPGSGPVITSLKIDTDTDGAGYCYYDDVFVTEEDWTGEVGILGLTVTEDLVVNSGYDITNWTRVGGSDTWDALGDFSDATYMKTTVEAADMILSHHNIGYDPGRFIYGRIHAKVKSTEDGDTMRFLTYYVGDQIEQIDGPETTLYGNTKAVTESFVWYYENIESFADGEFLYWVSQWYLDVGITGVSLAGELQVAEFTTEYAMRYGKEPWKKEEWRFTPRGNIITCWIHSGMMDVGKYFSAIKAFAANVDSQFRQIMVFYRTDIDKAWIPLARYAGDTLGGVAIDSEDAEELSLYTEDEGYATGHRIQIKLQFTTEHQTITPDLLTYVLETFPKIPRRRIFTMPIRIQANREDLVGGITYEAATTYYNSLTGLISSLEPVVMRSTNPIVDGAKVEVVGLDNERIFVDPNDPDLVYLVATLTMVEVD